MAYTVKTSGMSELLQRMEKIGDKAQEVASQALYEGAGVVANEVSKAIQGIATKEFTYPAPPGKTRLPSPEEKAILQQARHGISKFRKSTMEVNTSIGFQNSGYAMLKNRRVPVPLIANAINSGTSFMTKQPFMRRAVLRSKTTAVSVVEKELKKRLDELSLD